MVTPGTADVPSVTRPTMAPLVLVWAMATDAIQNIRSARGRYLLIILLSFLLKRKLLRPR
jgi:hypothetical protein